EAHRRIDGLRVCREREEAAPLEVASQRRPLQNRRREVGVEDGACVEVREEVARQRRHAGPLEAPIPPDREFGVLRWVARWIKAAMEIADMALVDVEPVEAPRRAVEELLE